MISLICRIANKHVRDSSLPHPHIPVCLSLLQYLETVKGLGEMRQVNAPVTR